MSEQRDPKLNPIKLPEENQFKKHPIKKQNIESGDLRVYWDPYFATTEEDALQKIRMDENEEETGKRFFYPASTNNRLLDDEVENDFYDLNYTPPILWPKKNYPLVMPRVVMCWILQPYSLSPYTGTRYAAWKNYFNNTLTSEFEETNNLHICPNVDLLTMTRNGLGNYYLRNITPRSEDVDADGGFLGLDILNIIIYQDAGATFLIPPFSMSDETNGYTACQTIKDSYSYNKFVMDPTRTEIFIKDKDYFKKAHQYFQRHSTFIYYDSSSLLANDGLYVPPSTRGISSETHVIGYEKTKFTGMMSWPGITDPIQRWDKTIYITGGTFEQMNPGQENFTSPTIAYYFPSVPTLTQININNSNPYYDGPDFLIRDDTRTTIVYNTYVNIWDEVDNYQQVHLSQLSGELENYGVKYKGKIQYTDSELPIIKDIKDYFKIVT